MLNRDLSKARFLNIKRGCEAVSFWLTLAVVAVCLATKARSYAWYLEECLPGPDGPLLLSSACGHPMNGVPELGLLFALVFSAVVAIVSGVLRKWSWARPMTVLFLMGLSADVGLDYWFQLHS